jgi:hypothetical protein
MLDLHIPVLILQGEAEEIQGLPWVVPKEQPLGVILAVVESDQLELPHSHLILCQDQLDLIHHLAEILQHGLHLASFLLQVF